MRLGHFSKPFGTIRFLPLMRNDLSKLPKYEKRP